MKKLIIFCIFITFLIASNVMAAEITINKAVQTTENGAVNVECSISGYAENQSITVIACELGDLTYQEDVIYIDQFCPAIYNEGSAGVFSFDFFAADHTDKNKAYLLKVGGLGVDIPAVRIIAFYNGNAYMAGDVNGDSVVDKIDAELVLKHISGISQIPYSYFASADCNNDTVIDITDVVKILQK